jgi:hypothetical protein
MIVDVNGGIGNQLFHVASAVSFSVKFKIPVEVQLRGTDTSKHFNGKWHLGPLQDELTKRYDLKFTRYRYFHEKLLVKSKNKVKKPKNIINQDVEDFFTANKDSKANVFISHIESKLLATYANRKGFRKVLREFRDSRVISEIVKAPNSNAIAIHLRRIDSGIGLSNLDSWWLSDNWYLKCIDHLTKKSSVTPEIFVFTNSLKEAGFIAHNFPKVTAIGPELSPLLTVFSISTFDNLILSKSTFSFWAAEISNATKIISAYKKSDVFSPSKKYQYFKKIC